MIALFKTSVACAAILLLFHLGKKFIFISKTEYYVMDLLFICYMCMLFAEVKGMASEKPSVESVLARLWFLSWPDPRLMSQGIFSQ